MRPTAYRHFLEQLATLLESGVPIAEALVLLGRSQRESLAREARALSDSIRKGSSIAEALASRPKAFPAAHAALIGAAERAGFIPRMLRRLRDETDRRIAARKALASRSAYPLAILALAALVTPLHFVVEGELGKYIAIELSIFGCAAAAVALGFALREKLRILLEGAPILGGILRRAALGESLVLTGLLVEAGIGVREALRIAADSARRGDLARGLREASGGLDAGKNLSDSLERIAGLPAMEHGIIATGEQAGAVDRALQDAGRSLEESARGAVGWILRVLPAILFIIVAAIVGFVYIRTFLNLYGEI